MKILPFTLLACLSLTACGGEDEAEPLASDSFIRAHIEGDGAPIDFDAVPHCFRSAARWVVRADGDVAPWAIAIHFPLDQEPGDFKLEDYYTSSEQPQMYLDLGYPDPTDPASKGYGATLMTGNITFTTVGSEPGDLMAGTFDNAVLGHDGGPQIVLTNGSFRATLEQQ